MTLTRLDGGRPYVERLADLGVTKGCSPGNFCPHDHMTRAQMASFLARAFDLSTASAPGSQTSGRFKDVSVDSHHVDNITLLRSFGISLGCGEDRFCPDRSTTKAQTVTFLHRARNVDLWSYRLVFDSQGGDINLATVYNTDPQEALNTAVNISGDNTISDEGECEGDFCSNQYWSNTDPSWSPDGRWIAFISDRPKGLTPNLYTMRSNGEGVIRLAAADANPSWSPDGGRIAYEDDGHVYVIDADGADRVRLVEGGSPSWSPDGGRIAYEDDGAVYVIDADGADRVWLVEGGSPSWSPDGGRIAYEDDGQVHVMTSEGRYLRQLTRYGGANPAWSPDGRRIAYEGSYLFLNPYSFRSIYSSLAREGIVVMNADGSNHFRVSNFAYSPAWAPSGDSS